MFLLMRLELSKFKIKKYILFSVLILMGICLFTTISLFAIEQDHATNYEDAIKMINAAIIDCYLIFGAILVMKVIVEEYLKRTVSVLFTYSVNRYKLMLSKVVLVLGITVSFWLITEIISISYLGTVGNHLGLALNTFSAEDFIYWLEQLGWGFMIMLCFIMLIADVAFIKKTSQYVFITSLISVVIVQIIISQSLKNYVMCLGMLSLLITMISIKKYSDRIE